MKFVTDTFVDAEEFHLWPRLPIVALGCLASRVRYHAMDLTLTWDTESLNHPYWIFMFPGDDIATFCRILLTSGKFANPKSSLSIAMTDVAPSEMSILKLMEPFRRLHSIASVTITGKIEAKYKSDLIVRMLRRAGDTDAYFQEYQDTMEQGDQAATNRDYSTAIARYRRALEEGDDFCAVYNDHDIMLKSGKYQGQCFDLAFIQIKFALEYKLAVIYLNLGNHRRAHAWISLAVEDLYSYPNIKKRFERPANAAHASVSTIAAQASEVLELAERAVEEMKEEAQCDPGDLGLAEKQERSERALRGVKKLLQGGDGGLGKFKG